MRLFSALVFTITYSLASGQTTLPIEISKSGHLYIKATINGVEGNFMFDTAGGLHVVSNQFYQKIKLFKGDSSYFTAFRHTGERLDLPIHQFSKVSLGTIEQKNAWVGVYAGFDGLGFDGLISLKLIQHQPITIDTKNKQIIIETSQSLLAKKGQVVPLLLHEDRNCALDVFIKTVVGGKHTAFLEFDTGAGYSPILLNSRYINYANLDTTKMEISKAGTGFGKTEMIYFDKSNQLHLLLPDLNNGGNPNFIFKSSLIYDGLTSHVIFEGKSWTIDLPNKRLIVYP
jgi:hypothetical protein